ncbi:MAG TPA: toxic anion resistance protein [Candidatus Limnocylindrales bacterium]
MTEPSLDLSSTAPVAAPAPAATDVATTGNQTTTGTLTLEPPAPVTAVPAAQAEEAVKLDPGQAQKLDAMVSSYLDSVTKLDTHDPAFTSRVNDIDKLGADDIRASANVSNRLLDKPMAAVSDGGISQAGQVSKSLLALRRQVEDLDPQKQGNLLSAHKLLGIIPLGDRLENYFRKYQSSQTQINSIIVSLYDGQDELRHDNADIDQEKLNLWAIMGRLRQYAYLAEQLDTGLTQKIAQIQATDPDRAKVLQDDLLFPVRQKRQDLLTQLAVSVQGYLALDLIRRNNLELVKGVDRATTTTISALRTAVIVAQALSDQKLVLDQITALNQTTGDLIESTSDMLHQQSGKISEQAASATIDLAQLQKAFQNIYATMDEIDSFKVKALDNMETTINALSTEIDKSHTYINRVRAQDAADAARGSGDDGNPNDGNQGAGSSGVSIS